eukprot:scaffold6361_cov50-Attheya_sp.AAC.1
MLLTESSSSSSSSSLSTLLRRRGPDASGRVSIPIPPPLEETTHTNVSCLHMVGHVLHLRGTTMTKQPTTITTIRDQTIHKTNHTTSDSHPHEFFDDSSMEGGVLCWNGELYDYMRTKDMDLTQTNNASSSSSSLELQCCEMDMEQSDTDMVLQLFHQAITDDNDRKEDGLTTCAILANVLSHCKGEYAFIYYIKGHVYYGRDPLGRRSLLRRHDNHNNNNNRVLIASVGLAHQTNNNHSPTNNHQTITATNDDDNDDSSFQTENEDSSSSNTAASLNFVDIPPGVVTKLSLETGTILEEAPIRLSSSLMTMTSIIQSIYTVEAAADLLLQVLDVAVRRRVTNIASTTTAVSSPNNHRSMDPSDPDGSPSPPSDAIGMPASVGVKVVEASVGVLFSGGLDSVVLAALAHRHVPMDEPIDLINVAFSSNSSHIETHESPDRLAAVQSWVELQIRYPNRQWRLLAVDVTESELETHLLHIANLVYPSDTHMDLNIGAALWFAARATGKFITASHMEGTQSTTNASASAIRTPKN